LIRELIVVEGKSDTAAIRRAVEADTIETGGSAVSEEVIERIRLAREKRGVIIFTDPDHAGERIRRLITRAVPGCKHAFLDVSEAECDGDIGVENAEPEAIVRALERVRTDMQRAETDIGWDDLMRAGLINRADSSRRRAGVGRLLGIGYANGKQFFKRCQMFQITRAELEAAVRTWEQSEAGEEDRH
jgi:ribonuclease M5